MPQAPSAGCPAQRTPHRAPRRTPRAACGRSSPRPRCPRPRRPTAAPCCGCPSSPSSSTPRTTASLSAVEPSACSAGDGGADRLAVLRRRDLHLGLVREGDQAGVDVGRQAVQVLVGRGLGGLQLAELGHRAAGVQHQHGGAGHWRGGLAGDRAWPSWPPRRRRSSSSRSRG